MNESPQLSMFDFPEAVQETYGITNKKLIERAEGKGIHCPLCRQFVKVYRRSIYGTMAQALILILKEYQKNGWIPGDQQKSVHADILIKSKIKESTGSGLVALLRFWGLLTEGLESGYWTLTQKGELFAKGLISVPKYIKLYNNEFYGYDGEFIYIKDCKGKKFNYEELMEVSHESNKV